MLNLVTGVPGAGKTLNTLKMVEDEISETDRQNRQIYYRGIRELTLDGWEEISDDQVKEWFNFPPGSIFVIDECQQIWPNNRGQNGQMPESISRLDTHRHQGYDFYIITQQPTLVDHGVRKFVGRHYHYERQMGWEGCRRLHWERCVDRPQDDEPMRDQAIKERIKFPKKYYSAYKSAEIHTFKKRFPKKLVYLVGLLGTFALGAAYVYANVIDRGGDFEPSQYEDIPVTSESTGRSLLPDLGNQRGVPMTTEEYVAQYQPRIPGFPHTAPIYDELTVVKTFPRPQCVHFVDRDECRCFSQQATPIEMDFPTCLQIVESGWFNPFRDEDQATAERGAGRASAPRPREDRLDGPRIVQLGTGQSYDPYPN